MESARTAFYIINPKEQALNDITTSGYERCVTLRKEFEDWTVTTNTGYPLDKNTDTHHAMASYEDVRTEHAWRGFFNGAEQRFVEGQRRVGGDTIGGGNLFSENLY